LKVPQSESDLINAHIMPGKIVIKQDRQMKSTSELINNFD